MSRMCQGRSVRGKKNVELVSKHGLHPGVETKDPALIVSRGQNAAGRQTRKRSCVTSGLPYSNERHEQIGQAMPRGEMPAPGTVRIRPQPPSGCVDILHRPRLSIGITAACSPNKKTFRPVTYFYLPALDSRLLPLDIDCPLHYP